MQAIVTAIREGRLSATVGLIVSNRRKAPGLARAAEQGLPHAYLRREADIDRALVEAGVELVVLAGYMRILSPEFVGRWRIVNIHPSLLPKFPGLHAQRQALEAGATESGCTVHFVDEGVDTGPIIMQARVPVLPDDTEDTLSARILVEEHQLYPRALERLAQSRKAAEARGEEWGDG